MRRNSANVTFLVVVFEIAYLIHVQVSITYLHMIAIFLGETVGQARKLADLPMWLQYYPKTLFDTINRSGTGVITKKELKLFYTAFIDAGKLGDTALNALTEKSYNAMTSNGDTQLSLHMYRLSFLNFLLGKTRVIVIKLCFPITLHR